MKPILKMKESFDATLETTFVFSVTSLISSSEIFIYKNDDSKELVGSYKNSSKKYQLVLPPTLGLENGKYYTAAIVVYDLVGNKSEQSNFIDFYCLETPTFGINISNGDVLDYATTTVSINYSQAQNDKLNWFHVEVKTETGDLVYAIEKQYAYNGTDFLVTGLETGKNYTIQVNGETVSEMLVDTGIISFSVKYKTPYFSPLLSVSNHLCEGKIEINSKIHSIFGSTEGDVQFIDNEKIDLTDGKVIFDSGFNIDGDFVLHVLGNNFISGETIMELSDQFSDGKIVVRYMVGEFLQFDNVLKSYIEMEINGIYHYWQISNYIDPPEAGDTLHFAVTRKNHKYKLLVEKV